MRNISVATLALGAVLVWVAWALMPDAATNDAAHILTAVAGARDAVRASAILQLWGSALLAQGLAGEIALERRAPGGLVAVLIGALGMAADAVFHQLAYEMTAPGVARDAVLPVMARMQTAELRPHLPLLLLFFVGAVALGIQRRRHAVGSGRSAYLLMGPAIIIPLGILSVRTLGAPRRLVALATLGSICAGLVSVAVDRWRAEPDAGTPR